MKDFSIEKSFFSWLYGHSYGPFVSSCRLNTNGIKHMRSVWNSIRQSQLQALRLILLVGYWHLNSFL